MKPSYPDPSLPEDFQDVLQSSEFSQEPPEFREEGRVSPFPLTSVQVISSRVPNNNNGANQTYYGKEASDDLQFSLDCSQANSTRPGSRSCSQSQSPPSTSRITPEDALKVDQPQLLLNFSNIYCLYSFSLYIKMLEIWWSFSWYSYTSTHLVNTNMSTSSASKERFDVIFFNPWGIKYVVLF